MTSADIPGPQVPLYFAGAQLLEVFPLVQLLGTVSLAVGAISYAGQFNIMVIADRESYPDLDVFAAGVRDGLRAFTLQPGAVRPARDHRTRTSGPLPRVRRAPGPKSRTRDAESR